MKKNVRTITINDRMGRASHADMIALESASQRNNSLKKLVIEKELRERELQVALSAARPNMAKIASLRAAIQNMAGTLSRAQR